MTRRRSMSTTRRLRIFEAHGGICCLCETKIKAGEKWTIEHLKALGLCGEDEDENCGPAHEACRREKDKDDISRMAKADRAKARHLGAKAMTSRPVPGSKASGWKKSFNHGWIRRHAD